MEDGAFGGSFGKYDVTTHDQNKKNTGYNNSLNEGSNFSTTLGGNFSTVVGANLSTTVGLSMSSVGLVNFPATFGGKIELIMPWSIKWTRGNGFEGNTILPDAWDYDFKNCQTQVKWNEGYVYNYSKNKTTELGLDDNRVVAKKVETFAEQAEKWLKKETTACTEEIKKIVSGTMSYGTMTTTVAGAFVVWAGAYASFLTMEATGMTLSTTGNLNLKGGAGSTISSAGKTRIMSAILNLC